MAGTVWVTRMVTKHMEIPLFEQGETLHFERAVLYPYPDNKRVWTRLWLTAVPDSRPNIEILLNNPDGSENTSVYLMAQTEQRAETMLHLRRSATRCNLSLCGHPLGFRAWARRSTSWNGASLIYLTFRNPDRGDRIWLWRGLG